MKNILSRFRSAGFVYLLLSWTIIFSSCQKDVAAIKAPEKYTTFSDVFEGFWIGMNKNYVFWDVDTTNWDKVYQQYQPVFATLNKDNPEDQKKSVKYFKEMLGNIVDGHFDITFKPSAIQDSSFYPALLRKAKADPDFYYIIPDDHFLSAIPDNYLDNGYKTAAIELNDDNLAVVSGTINNSILYFYFNKFLLWDAWDDAFGEDTQGNSTPNNEAGAVLAYFFNHLKNLPPNIKGIIIDVRENPGGNILDQNFLLGRFIDKPLVIGQTRYKLNPGRLDYTPWADAVIKPFQNGNSIRVPVIALVNKHTISMAEVLAMTVKSLPNGKLVGERTWGGHGGLMETEDFNGGSFRVPGFLTVNAASTMFRYKDGKIYEGIGVPPDIEIKTDKTAIAAGRDLQLEKAISLIP